MTTPKSLRSILASAIFLLLIGSLGCNGKNEKLTALRSQLDSLTATYHSNIGIAVIHLENKDTLTLNNLHQYPMQSVYKFPLAIAVLHAVDEHKLSLQQKIHITKTSLRPNTWSPLREKSPEGNIDLSIAELLNYTVSQSDNNTCDILFELMGGTKKVNDFIHHLGVKKISIAATEEEMHRESDVQFSNWTEPFTMATLLKGFYEGKFLSDSSNQFLMKLMIESSNSANRLKGLLPEKTIVAHKTGTSNTNALGIQAAVNDVGIITLPNGHHLVLCVFVTESSDDTSLSEKNIATISRLIFDFFQH